MTQCWMWTWGLENLLQTRCSHVDNNDNVVSIWKEDYHQELELKSLLLVLYCSMYIISCIFWHLVNFINTSSTMHCNGSSILIGNLTSAWSWLSDESRPRSRCRWSEPPAAASDHLDYLGRGLDQDQDQDNQQQQQQGFLRRRPSQPGRFSLPRKQIWDCEFLSLKTRLNVGQYL